MKVIKLLLWLLMVFGHTYANKQPNRPNIVFILADDLGYADMGAYGQQLIQTPHLDQLAAGGIRFTQHYAGSTVCAPSRNVLMTGEHTGHTYIRGNYAWDTEGNVPLPETTVTVARLFQQQGYHTGIFGKWGLGGPNSGGGPNSQGFDESLCYLDQREAHDYFPRHLWKNEEKLVLSGNDNNGREIYSHELFVNGAEQFIREHATDPFFLYLPFTLPHGRYEGPDDRPYTDKPWSENERHYAAMITRLDRDIGRILELLRTLKLDENTVVFFASDNGPVKNISKRFHSNGNFRGYKTELYEGGIRVPLIVKWSGQITPGQTTNQLSAFQDFLPTACELAGIPVPNHIDGISYLPVLQGRELPKQHDYLYWEYFEYNYNWEKSDRQFSRTYLNDQAIRIGKWKGIRTGLYDNPNAKIALYDIEKDPSETQDESANHPEIIQQMKILLETARNDSPFFKKYSQTPIRVDHKATIEYVFSCQKPNGAFGPIDQAYTDVAWTFPAVRTLQLLGVSLPDADSCLTNGGQSWMEKAPWKNGPWYWSFYQKASLYALYGRKDHHEPGIIPGSSWEFTYIPRKNYTEFRDYLKGTFFDMESLWHMTAGILALGGNIQKTDAVAKFIHSKQLPSGCFGNHLIHTHAAVRTLSALHLPIPNRDQCIRWLQACQREDGGFGWSPDHPSASNRSDVWYTWAAVMALHELGTQPKQMQACIDWLNGLQNADGGFGDQPGWNSRLYSTYYAVEALQVLTDDAASAISEKTIIPAADNRIPEGVFHIYQTQHKTPVGGQGMVDSMVNLGFHLIGIKTKEGDVLNEQGMSRTVREARTYAAQKGYDIEIVDCPENYGHRLIWFDGQPADHVSNFMIPPEMNRAEHKQFLASYQAGKANLPWDDFKEQVIKPMVSTGVLFYPELDYTLLNAYLVYDEGLYNDGGYNAVPGAHFGNIDWVRHFPYHERWVGKLPIIADGDAHGDMQAWEVNLNQYRNVFLATDNNLTAYVEAAKEERSVCVIVMPGGEVRYYGAQPAVSYLKKHLDEWKWW